MKNLTIDIWKGLNYEGKDPNFRPDLRTYILDEGFIKDRPRPAILIVPGGGYGCFGTGEQECVAMQFAAAGYHTFILRYSINPNRHPQPLLDLSRAMYIIREHAEEWRVDEDKIAILGFSAGGHLCASFGTLWNRDFLQLPDTKAEQNKPNAMVLCYPVITSDEAFTHMPSMWNLLGEELPEDQRKLVSPELQVSDATPPAFIWHTFADPIVPTENALMMASALRKQGIPFELHIYPEGPHGMSIANDDGTTQGANPHIATWVPLCREWLKLQFGV
ncbi:MAG: alpha/beta hydrolase [Clostridia bacterium]|nr:alpha/beta hydrolase [Clostridia bacterium]